MAFQQATATEINLLWIPRHLGQALFEPPNVAGWPVGERWLDPDSILRRTGLAVYLDLDKVPGGPTGSVDQILDACGLVVVGDATLDALDRADDGKLDAESVTQLRWAIALSCPEFQLT